MKNILGNSNFGFTKWCVALVAAGWMGAAQVQAQTRILAWDFTGESNNVSSIADIVDSSLDSTNTLIRGPGAAASSAGNSFRTVGFQNNGISTTNTDYFQFSLSATNGKLLSLNSITARFGGTTTYVTNSPGGATNQFAYSTNGANWTLIGSPTVVTGSNNANWNMTVVLSNILALQNLSDNVTASFRYYASGQTTTGGWGFYSSSTNTYGLEIDGTLSSTTTPTIMLNPTSLNGLTTTTGANSSVTNYTVTGANLGTTNITVTPNSSLIEVSTNASSGFATNALTLTQTGGVVSNTVYLRIGTNSTATNISSTISHVSGSASTNLTVSGTISQAGQPPVVTSTNFPGQVNVFFSNAISASGSPTNYTLVSGTLPGGLTFNSTNGTISGKPTNAVTNNLTVTAANSAGTSSNATIGLAIAKGDQTITFTNNLSGLVAGSTNALTAKANSGLSVTYTSSATNVATISGSNVVAVGVGSSTITASQAGDDNWNAATDVSQTLTVYPSGMAYWNFNTDTPTVVPSGWTIGAVSQGNNNGTTAMLSSSSATNAVVYSNTLGVAASLSTNAQAAARIGAINTGTSGSAYFEFTVTAPLSSTNLAITNIFFGYRSTSTGPQGYSIRSSADNYAADIPGGSGALANNSTWAAVSAPVSVLMTNGQNTMFRIYGRDGTGSPGSGTANWRIDDLTLAIGALELNQPSLTLTPSSLSGLSTFNGTPSAGTSYVINGSNLSNEVAVTASSPVLEVSSNNITFTNTLNISPSLGSVSNTTLYVRISGTAGQGTLAGAYVRHISTGLTSDLAVAGNVYDATRGASSNSLIGWDASGQTNYGVSPWAPAVSASNLTIASNLTRGSGVLTTGTAAARGWGGVDWSSPDVDTAVSSNKFASFTIAANTGYKLSLSSISKLDYRRSSSGPTSGVVQVQIGSGSFSNVAALSFPGTNTLGENLAAAIDLSTNPTLQNIPANAQVTLRIVNFGGTNTTGTWYIYDKDNNPNLDFEVTGSVDVAPAVPPTITSTNAFSGTVGVAFSNKITATGDAPITFSGTGLPNGLLVATNGVISGTPTAAGPFNATLAASNSVVSTNQAATFTIAKGTPSITAVPTASAITDGKVLSDSLISDGTVNPFGGAWAWSAPATVVTAGTNSYAAVYTPASGDQVNWNSLTSNLTVVVNPAAPTESSFFGWLGSNAPSAELLLQYAYGAVSPSNTVNRSNLPASGVSGGNLVLTYYVRDKATNLSLVIPQLSSDLANTNSWGTNGITQANLGTNSVDGVNVVKKTAAVPIDSTNRKFLRLRISE